jgi:hypothetical protein
MQALEPLGNVWKSTETVRVNTEDSDRVRFFEDSQQNQFAAKTEPG